MYCINYFEDCLFVLANSEDPDEMPHYVIWVITVCQSTRLGAADPKRDQQSWYIKLEVYLFYFAGSYSGIL